LGDQHLTDTEIYNSFRGRCCRDRMVVGFTTTCAITTNVLSLNPANGYVYSMQQYVIKFVRDNKHGHHRQFLFLIGRFLKQLFL
jgi:hypothetical protein